MNLQADVDDYGTLSDSSTLTIHRWLPGPVERIWTYLTDSDLRRKWLAAGDMPLASGASMELVWRNDDLSDPSDPRPPGFPEEQRMASHVVSVDPMRMLTIAWGKGDVTFELTPKGDKVLLTLTHRGLDDRGARTMIAAGWHMHLDILLARVSGKGAGSFWSGWTRLKGLYDDRLQN
jgi:uncharacterized protein YndB with AHSA1/START domain